MTSRTARKCRLRLVPAAARLHPLRTGRGRLDVFSQRLSQPLGAEIVELPDDVGHEFLIYILQVSLCAE